MSLYKLKTNFEAHSEFSLQKHLLSEDLKYLVTYTNFYLTVTNLVSKTVLFSNDCTSQMRIAYCAIDHESLIVQYQTSNGYLLQIRKLKNPLFCNEFETYEEVTCHINAEFNFGNQTVSGIFFGTELGNAKFLNFNSQELSDVDFKDNPNIKKPPIAKMLLFTEPNISLFITADNTGLLEFYTFDEGFNLSLKNSYLANTETQWLIEIFRISRGTDETLLGLVFKIDEYVSLYTAEPSHFTRTLDNLNAAFVRTVLGNYTPNVKCLLLKEKWKPNLNNDSKGDLLALIDDASNQFFIDVKLHSLKTQQISERQYDRSERVKHSAGLAAVDQSGLLLQCQDHNTNRVKVNLCLVLNNGMNVFFDEISFGYDDRFEKLIEEQYKLFNENFELTPFGSQFIETKNYLPTQIIRRAHVDPLIFDLKVDFLEFLFKNGRHQILVDILNRREQRQGEGDQSYAILSLERCEEIVFQVFQQERDETKFDYENVDRDGLRRYKSFLNSILMVFNAIIKRKEEEAITNTRELNTAMISNVENDILMYYNFHRDHVLKETNFCRILEFFVENSIGNVYNNSLQEIHIKWNENRAKYDEIFNERRNPTFENYHKFFIDLFLQGEMLYPATVDDIFNWIRTSDTPNKKFLIFYIIKRDLANIASLDQQYVATLINKFLNKFNLTDKELNILNGLVSLDLLIGHIIPVIMHEFSSGSLNKSQEFPGIAKEACFHLSACDLENDQWKSFILNTFYQYECYDELAIFIRSGHISWKDPELARRQVAILLGLKKVLMAYYFVSTEVELDETGQNFSASYRDLFDYFVEQVISQGLTNELYNISLQNHEKKLLRDYFERNSGFSKQYILYLLKFNQVIEAVDFFAMCPENVKRNGPLVRFLVWKANELPELLRNKLEQKNPQLYSLYNEFKNNVDPSDNSIMMEESSNSRGAMGMSFRPVRREYSVENLLDQTGEKLYQTSWKRGTVNFSVSELQNAVKNREILKQELGLVFSGKGAVNNGGQGEVLRNIQNIEEERI